MPISTIITGSSGMVGHAVLLQCLDSPAVAKVVVINRHSIGLRHPKLSEIIHQDFSDISAISQELTDYDACFFCAGVSSIGKNETEYTRLTYDLVTSFATTLHGVNPSLVFTYVSGMGTDPDGRQMWARVKGRTENHLLGLGFRAAYMFRLGLLLPTGELPTQTGWTKVLYELLRPLFPLLGRASWSVTDRELGRAMINCVRTLPPEHILESKDIGRLAHGAGSIS